MGILLTSNESSMLESFSIALSVSITESLAAVSRDLVVYSIRESFSVDIFLRASSLLDFFVTVSGASLVDMSRGWLAIGLVVDILFRIATRTSFLLFFIRTPLGIESACLGLSFNTTPPRPSEVLSSSYIAVSSDSDCRKAQLRTTLVTTRPIGRELLPFCMKYPHCCDPIHVNICNLFLEQVPSLNKRR